MPTDEWRAVRGSLRELRELGRRVEQKHVLSLGPPLALRPPQRCALRELAEMPTTLAQIRQDRLLTYVRRYKALGRGWSLSDAQWTAQQHEMAR